MVTCQHYILLLLLLVSARSTIAQSSAGLPLQPEKLAYAKEVEQEALTKNDTLLMAEAYYLYGKIHVNARDYLTAKRYFLKSLRIVEQRRQFDKISRIYSRLSWLEREQTNLTKQLEYAQTALTYARLGTQKSLMAAFQSMSDTYLTICYDSLVINRKHPLEDSLFYYAKQSEQIAYKLKDSISVAGVSTMLAKVYGFQRKPQAFHYYQIALRIYTALNQTYRQVIIGQQMAQTYLQFNQPDKAYPLLQQASVLYHSITSREFEVEKDFASSYMQYYQQKGDWEKAFEQLLKVRGYERDQMMADRNGAVSRLSFEYDTKKKERQLKSQRRELQLSQQNQRTQHWLLVVLSALLLGTAGTSIAFYRISRKNKRLSQQNAALVQEQNHRVKNNLQLISSLLSLQSNRLGDESARNAVEDSQRRIEVMSLLQRKLYDGDNLVTVNVADFVPELVNMVLEAFEQEQVEVEYQMEPVVMLPVDSMMRVGLIMNELITNACKYAFPDNPKPTLQITAYIMHKTFHMRVIDNGPGFMNTNAPIRSFGLRLIQMQVEQLFGTYRFEKNGSFQFDMTFTLFPPSPFRIETKISKVP
ncbi:sensor histidine kinase [Dyadobacter sp. 32]|uniref:sensor histidine kinase n=1 Tax=Dyadobacter sp. 32 TaxID=538966 RepID=UPI0011ED10C6